MHLKRGLSNICWLQAFKLWCIGGLSFWKKKWKIRQMVFLHTSFYSLSGYLWVYFFIFIPVKAIRYPSFVVDICTGLCLVFVMLVYLCVHYGLLYILYSRHSTVYANTICGISAYQNERTHGCCRWVLADF